MKPFKQGFDGNARNAFICFLSLAGVFASKREGVVPVALEQYLKTHPGIRHIHLHLDNDEVGKAAAAGIRKGLEGRYTVSNEPPKSGKDVNEYLTMVNNCTLNLHKEMCKSSISLDKHTLIR